MLAILDTVLAILGTASCNKQTLSFLLSSFYLPHWLPAQHSHHDPGHHVASCISHSLLGTWGSFLKRTSSGTLKHRNYSKSCCEWVRLGEGAADLFLISGFGSYISPLFPLTGLALFLYFYLLVKALVLKWIFFCSCPLPTYLLRSWFKKKSIYMNFLCSRDIKPFLPFAVELFLCPIFVSLAFAIQTICSPSVKFTPVNKKGHI